MFVQGNLKFLSANVLLHLFNELHDSILEEVLLMLFLKDLTLGQEQAFKESEITFKVTFDLTDLSEGFNFIFGNGNSFLG